MSSEPAALFSLVQRPALLVARFARAQRMLSWSLNRPGFTAASEVAFVEVRGRDLPADVCPHDLLARRLADGGVPDAVGLMTSRDIRCHHVAVRAVEEVSAACLVTAGLNNGERVGARVALPWLDLPDRDPPDTSLPGHALGTVNILAATSHPLSEGALLEALSIVTQARTLAILEAGYVREGAEGPVTGTGTDCIVVSAPQEGAPLAYAGLHTAMGEALGAAVLAASRAATAEWLAQRVRG